MQLTAGLQVYFPGGSERFPASSEACPEAIGHIIRIGRSGREYIGQVISVGSRYRRIQFRGSGEWDVVAVRRIDLAETEKAREIGPVIGLVVDMEQFHIHLRKTALVLCGTNFSDLLV